MDNDTNFALNGLALSVAVLAHNLSKEGALDLSDYLNSLNMAADNASMNPGPALNGISADYLRLVVRAVELGPDPKHAPWRPSVIEGGKQQPPQDHQPQPD